MEIRTLYFTPKYYKKLEKCFDKHEKKMKKLTYRPEWLEGRKYQNYLFYRDNNRYEICCSGYHDSCGIISVKCVGCPLQQISYPEFIELGIKINREKIV